jgi:inner membrane protein
MPLPVAHSLIGASVAGAVHPKSEQWWKVLCLGAFLGVLPDLDYILNWLRVGWGGWHHGFTHSLVFALVVGAVTAVLTRWSSVRNVNARGFVTFSARSFITFSAAIASHGLLDYLITESRGIALFWPFTDHRYKLRAPNPINYTWSDASLWDAAVDILRISLIELLIFAPLLLFVIWLRIMATRKGKLLHGMDH